MDDPTPLLASSPPQLTILDFTKLLYKALRGDVFTASHSTTSRQNLNNQLLAESFKTMEDDFRRAVCYTCVHACVCVSDWGFLIVGLGLSGIPADHWPGRVLGEHRGSVQSVARPLSSSPCAAERHPVVVRSHASDYLMT